MGWDHVIQVSAAPLQSRVELALPGQSFRRVVQASYDAARTTSDNAKHFSHADHLSARAALSPDVRKKLRANARYEVSNSPYADGIALTLQNDTVGVGPRMQIISPDESFNSTVEGWWNSWAKEIRLWKKLRLARRSKAETGESFLVIAYDPTVPHPVKWNVTVVESDRVTTPNLAVEDELNSDGIVFDKHKNPVEYHILRQHPGDSFWTNRWDEFDRVEAKFVLHWFTPKRPGQIRGVTEFASQLNTMARERRYEGATLKKQENQAQISGFLEQTATPDAGDGEDQMSGVEPFTRLEASDGMFIALPDGTKPVQFAAKESADSFPQIKGEYLGAFGRPFGMSRNVVACDSGNSSFSSGKLDHRIYARNIEIEQDDSAIDILHKLFLFWVDVSRQSPIGIIPDDSHLDKWSESWTWPTLDDPDPDKTASADKTDIESGVVSVRSVQARRGLDPDVEERQKATELGMSVVEYRMAKRVERFPHLAAVAVGGAVGETVQDKALNGAQSDSLLKIITAGATKQLPVEAVRLSLRASFPSMPQELVDGLAESLDGFVPTTLPDGTPNPESDGAGGAVAVAAGGQASSPAFSEISRRQWTRNNAAIDDVIARLNDGTYSQARAEMSLRQIGIPQDEIDFLIADALDNGELDNSVKAGSPDSHPRIIEAAGGVSLLLPGRPLWGKVEAAAEGVSAESKPFTMDAYTGGELLLPGREHPVVIDLAGLDCSDQQRPILLQHDKTPNGIAGQSSLIVNDGKRISVEGAVQVAAPAGKIVADRARQGFPWEASIGVLIHREEHIPAGRSVVINGQSFSGPVDVVRTGRLREISFCVLGADVTGTRTTVAASLGGSVMTWEEFLAFLNLPSLPTDEAGLANLRKAYDAMVATPAAQPSAVAAAAPGAQPAAAVAANAGDARTINAAAIDFTSRRELEAAEIERVEAIRVNCTVGSKRYPLIEAQAIRENRSPDWARVKVLEASAPTMAIGSVSGANVGGWETRARVLEAAICRIGGIREERLESHGFTPQIIEASGRRDVRGLALSQLFGEFANAHGQYVRPGRMNESVIEAAVVANRIAEGTAGPRSLEADGASTMSLPGLLGNASNKILLEVYQASESVVDQFCATASAKDFKAFKSYRMTGKGELQSVGKDGELKHIQLQEEDYENRLAVKGAMLGLTREDMMNDDLSAFAKVSQVLAKMAIDSRETGVFRLLLANTGSFFHADNGNILTGGGSALSITSLDAAVKAFWELIDVNGHPILVPPKMLLLPPALKALADRIYTSSTVNETTTANVPKPVDNNHAGQYRPVVSPYLSTALNAKNGGNGSDKKWWLLSEPSSGSAIIEIAYLNGKKVPSVETGEMPFNTTGGMQWKIVYDFGIAFSDKRAGVQNDGE